MAVGKGEGGGGDGDGEDVDEMEWIVRVEGDGGDILWSSEDLRLLGFGWWPVGIHWLFEYRL